MRVADVGMLCKGINVPEMSIYNDQVSLAVKDVPFGSVGDARGKPVIALLRASVKLGDAEVLCFISCDDWRFGLLRMPLNMAEVEMGSGA